MSNSINIDQLSLVLSIINKISEDHPGFSASPRQYNAIVNAVNNIKDELSVSNTQSIVGEGLAAWLNSDDVGSSSKYMASILSGEIDPLDSHPCYPMDPDDFIRCRKLLLAVPEFEHRLSMMHGCSELWFNIIARWEELCTTLDEELPDWADKPGPAPKTHKLMEEILEC